MTVFSEGYKKLLLSNSIFSIHMWEGYFNIPVERGKKGKQTRQCLSEMQATVSCHQKYSHKFSDVESWRLVVSETVSLKVCLFSMSFRMGLGGVISITSFFLKRSFSLAMPALIEACKGNFYTKAGEFQQNSAALCKATQVKFLLCFRPDTRHPVKSLREISLSIPRLAQTVKCRLKLCITSYALEEFIRCFTNNSCFFKNVVKHINVEYYQNEYCLDNG